MVVAFTDMQGRLQGVRSTVRTSPNTFSIGTEVPHLLAVDVDMNTATGTRCHRRTRLTATSGWYWTCRRSAYRHQPGAVMVQCDAVWPDQTPVAQSPRTILKQQLAAAADREYDVLAGVQLQFMAFHTSYEDAWNAHYRDLAWSTSTTSTLDSGGLDRGVARDPQQGLRRRDGYRVGEGEPTWQHEIGLSHGDASTIADNHAVFKTMAKEIAAQHVPITFMAKYDDGTGQLLSLSTSSLRHRCPTVFGRPRPPRF